MKKKLMLCLVVAGALSAGFAVSGFATSSIEPFACKCEGRTIDNGLDWLNTKEDGCGDGFVGGKQEAIKNYITQPYVFMSYKYYKPILDDEVESNYDPDSGWRCVHRKEY
ncbi:MAG: hypothetical protein KKC20_05955 [Proteobacteria bacterium]|nr:hypothetical protein [Pseudomonadota bacterium]